jgi:hypothetical protein
MEDDVVAAGMQHVQMSADLSTVNADIGAGFIATSLASACICLA